MGETAEAAIEQSTLCTLKYHICIYIKNQKAQYPYNYKSWFERYIQMPELKPVIMEYIKSTLQHIPNKPYRRCAKKSIGSVLSCISFTNLRAVSGGSPVPVVETTTTRGAVSVFRSY